MCEPTLPVLKIEKQIASNSSNKFQFPLIGESCRNPQSKLSEFTNNIQFNILQSAKSKSKKKKNKFIDDSEFSASCTLQRLPDYHSAEFQGLRQNDDNNSDLEANVSDCDELLSACNQFECQQLCARPRYVTFRIEKEPPRDPYDPIVVDETYPELAAYIRQILDAKGTGNKLYGIDFEPCSPTVTATKGNPYEILVPTVIENLLNKLVSSYSLSPIDLEKFSTFLNVVSRLGLEDLNAYFKLLRMRGVVLADIIDSFQNQFWQLKTADMTTKELRSFLKNIKQTALFGDPLEEKKRKFEADRQLAKNLEIALKQAEQWARENSKKFPRPDNKDVLGKYGKLVYRPDAKPLAPILSKPSSQKEALKVSTARGDHTSGRDQSSQQLEGAAKGAQARKGDSSPRPLVIKKETDPKFQLKKYETQKESPQEVGPKKSNLKKETSGKDARDDQKGTQDTSVKKDTSKTQEKGQTKTLESSKKGDSGESPAGTQAKDSPIGGQTQKDNTRKKEGADSPDGAHTQKSSKKRDSGESKLGTQKDKSKGKDNMEPTVGAQMQKEQTALTSKIPGEGQSAATKKDAAKKGASTKEGKESAAAKDDPLQKGQSKKLPTTTTTQDSTTKKNEELTTSAAQGKMEPTSKESKSQVPTNITGESSLQKTTSSKKGEHISDPASVKKETIQAFKDGNEQGPFAWHQQSSQKSGGSSEDDKSKKKTDRTDPASFKKEILGKPPKDSKSQGQKDTKLPAAQDSNKTDRQDSYTIDTVSTKSLRFLPEREFRLKLAAAMSAAQKYADKTLFIPDLSGPDDQHRGTKRFTNDHLYETDGKLSLAVPTSKLYNDTWQLLERYSFLHSGAHHPGYYEPWDVEFPWPDLQDYVNFIQSFYVKRLPDPNFSFRRGMEYYQAIFRREQEEAAKTSPTNASKVVSKPTKK